MLAMMSPISFPKGCGKGTKLNQVLKPIRVKPEEYEWGLQIDQLLWRGEAFFDKLRTYAWFARFD